jgi:hypothetical protein
MQNIYGIFNLKVAENELQKEDRIRSSFALRIN